MGNQNRIRDDETQPSRRIRFAIAPSRASRFFLLLCIASIVVWFRPLQSLLSLAIHNQAYTHLLVIVPISVVLVLAKFKNSVTELRPDGEAGAVLLCVAVLLRIAASYFGRTGWLAWDAQLSLETLALVLFWLASFISCFGLGNFRRCMFPLLFLLWLVPAPQTAVNHIVTMLQDGTVSLTRSLFVLCGIPVVQHGPVLGIPGLTIEVAQECSSIRSSLLLAVCGMVVCYLLLHSFWGRVAAILFIVPLAIAKNSLRVFTLAILGAYVNVDILNSRLHRQGGVLFFAIALTALFALVGVVGRFERRLADPANATKLKHVVA